MFRALKYRLGVSEKLIGPNFESKFTTSFRSGSVFFPKLPKILGTCPQESFTSWNLHMKFKLNFQTKLNTFGLKVYNFKFEIGNKSNVMLITLSDIPAIPKKSIKVDFRFQS